MFKKKKKNFLEKIKFWRKKETHANRNLIIIISVLFIFTIALLGSVFLLSFFTSNIVVQKNLSKEDLEFWHNKIAHYQEQLKKRPNDSRIYADLANAYESIGQLSKALKMYKKAQNLRGKSAVLQKEIGDLYVEMKKYKQAEQAYQKALAISPNDWSLYAKLADFYQYKLKDYEKTKKVLEDALLKIGDNIEILYRIASFYELLDDRSRAAQYYKAIIDKNPKDEFAKRKYLKLSTPED